MIAALAAAVAGPRGHWLTIAVWVALAIGGFLCRAQIGNVTAAGQASFLPKGIRGSRGVGSRIQRRG